MFQELKKNKFEFILILFGVLISILWSTYNLKNFDTYKVNYSGVSYNQLIYHDMHRSWKIAENFKKNLQKGKNFFEALPLYEKFFLPPIITGIYYYLIDEDMHITSNDGEKVPKIDNHKFNLLIFQIILFYVSIFFFSKELKKKVNRFNYKVILLFLCLEPSILQWHSTFWSESIFISLMIFSFTIILKKTDNLVLNFILGVLIAFLFLQRSVSIFYIVPVIFYYLLIFKTNLKPSFFLLLGYFLIIASLGVNNFKKSGSFHILSKIHQYKSYYEYFAHIIYADKNNISQDEALEVLKEKEKKWITDNIIDYRLINENILTEDLEILEKVVKYRNSFFIETVLANPIFTVKYYSKKIVTMCIIHPFWAHGSYYVDKTTPEAKYVPANYYHKNLYKNIMYSMVIYFFVLVGFLSLLNRVKKRKIDNYDWFLIFNILSISYFIAISGFWGNPKYFAPCMISISFFFADGLRLFYKKIQTIS